MGFDDEDSHLDASTFQVPLGKLAEVLAQKVKREGASLLSAPGFVAIDLHVLLRQAMRTYDLLFYINADERRETDCYWRNYYSIVTLPLIRNMIDCFYNITAILQDPGTNGMLFRLSGFKKALNAFDEEESRYGGEPRWDYWIKKNRDGLDWAIRNSNLDPAMVASHTTSWPTLGKYIADKKTGGTTTPHQDFLRTFSFGRWREYSAMSHGAFEGLITTAMYYIEDSVPHDDRSKMDDVFPKILSMHIGRAAGILLCVVTELQAYFHFDDDGARINPRIHEMWKALMPVFEVKELYDERYRTLMETTGINP
jgi:hypothetical protein